MPAAEQIKGRNYFFEGKKLPIGLRFVNLSTFSQYSNA
jgi:hypothetical protein